MFDQPVLYIVLGYCKSNRRKAIQELLNKKPKTLAGLEIPQGSRCQNRWSKRPLHHLHPTLQISS